MIAGGSRGFLAPLETELWFEPRFGPLRAEPQGSLGLVEELLGYFGSKKNG